MLLYPLNNKQDEELFHSKTLYHYEMEKTESKWRKLKVNDESEMHEIEAYFDIRFRHTSSNNRSYPTKHFVFDT